MPSPTEITTAQLSLLIGLPHCPVLIDVCMDADFSESSYLIPGAKRYPDQDAAAILRHHGIQAETLAGGNQAWHAAQLPMMPAASIPTSGHNNHSVWVTKQRPKVDNIACPWLIHRLVDSKAQFLFVSSSEVLNVADIV
jgi:rhodanese-related sulfurtransferase